MIRLQAMCIKIDHGCSLCQQTIKFGMDIPISNGCVITTTGTSLWHHCGKMIDFCSKWTIYFLDNLSSKRNTLRVHLLTCLIPAS